LYRAKRFSQLKVAKVNVANSLPRQLIYISKAIWGKLVLIFPFFMKYSLSVICLN
jgi:hypothetical protein